jgi:WD40 repeat protein
MPRRRSLKVHSAIWILLAVMIVPPSVYFGRRRGTARPPSVQQAGELRPVQPVPELPDPSDTSFRYEAVEPARAPIAAAVASPSGRLVAILDEKGHVAVWDLDSSKRVSAFASKQHLPMNQRPLPAAAPMALAEPLGVGGPVLAMGDNRGQFRAWHAASGKSILTAAAVETPVDVAISTFGALFSAGRSGAMVLWSPSATKNGGRVWIAWSPGGPFTDIDVSPDSRTIAAATDRGVYLFNVALRTWTPLDTAVVRGKALPVEVRFNPGGGVLAATWTGSQLRLYSVATRTQLRTLTFAPTAPALPAFSPDGSLLAATDGGRIIQVWSVTTGGVVDSRIGPQGPIRAMWFTRDGRSLIVASFGDRYLRRVPVAAGR